MSTLSASCPQPHHNLGNISLMGQRQNEISWQGLVTNKDFVCQFKQGVVEGALNIDCQIWDHFALVLGWCRYTFRNPIRNGQSTDLGWYRLRNDSLFNGQSTEKLLFQFMADAELTHQQFIWWVSSTFVTGSAHLLAGFYGKCKRVQEYPKQVDQKGMLGVVVTHLCWRPRWTDWIVGGQLCGRVGRNSFG